MVVLSTSDEWQRQSALLLQARPTTTRITTKYNIPNLESPKYQKTKKRKLGGEAEKKDAEATPAVPRAYLTLKTYDPESGVVLKFKTDRAAEVGRLVNGLGRLGRHMAALPVKEDAQDTVMEDAAAQEPSADAAQATEATIPPPVDAKPQQGGGGGGGGKKKKKNKK